MMRKSYNYTRVNPSPLETKKKKTKKLLSHHSRLFNVTLLIDFF